MDKMRNALLGAMIGLVRAAEKGGGTEDTDRLLLEGLRALHTGEIPERLTELVREEKAKAAPGCARCAAPCGSTADADMTAVWQGEPETVRLKKELLRMVCGAADRILRSMKESKTDARALFLLHKGLFYIGEYAAPEELKAVLREMEELRGAFAA